MKKLTLAFLLTAIASQAQQKTSIEFALMGEIYMNRGPTKVFNMASLNASLAKKELQGFPEKIVLTEGQNPKPFYNVIMKRLEAANQQAKKEIHLIGDQSYYHEMPAICYRGNPVKAMKIINSMEDNFLHDYQLQAFRVRDYQYIQYKKEFFANNKETRENYITNGSGDAVKVWEKYNTNSKVILILSDLGPQGDGTELYATQVKPCK